MQNKFRFLFYIKLILHWVPLGTLEVRILTAPEYRLISDGSNMSKQFCKEVFTLKEMKLESSFKLIIETE
jgi:hypothetical protein